MGKNNRRRTNNRDNDNSSRGDGSASSTGDDHKTGNSAAASVVSSSSSSPQDNKNNTQPSLAKDNTKRVTSQRIVQGKQGILSIWIWTLLGIIVGFGIGSGWLAGGYRNPPSPWRVNLGGQIRANLIYQRTLGSIRDSDALWQNERVQWITNTMFGVLGTNKNRKTNGNEAFFSDRGVPSVVVRKVDSTELKDNPSHPYAYAVLREAVTREMGGYVHPDLGFLEPAPCGAARGVGMVRNRYHQCQTRCVPGLAQEKLQAKLDAKDESYVATGDRRYMQEEVLIKVPLTYQMTRKVALDTFLPRITSEFHRNAILELDDAALLVLLLAHERGVGQYSRWLPYIASLPIEPSCGYSQKHRPYVLDMINALRDEVGMDVDGWPGELIRASEYSERIVSYLAKDYGILIQNPKGMSATTNIRWALCQVASRAIGGSQKYGSLRMIPMVDMLNHDFQAAASVELQGTERLKEGDFVDAKETDEGAFVVRSLRYGRRRALRVGQELMINYNVPHYSALDWLVSSGFVPPERFQNWQKLDTPLPRIRRDGPFASIHGNGKNTRKQQEPDFFKFANTV